MLSPSAQAEGADRTLASLSAQRYENWDLLTPKHEQNPTDWAVVLRAGDRLAADALLRIAAHVQRNKDISVIYWDDEIHQTDSVLRTPRFKPDWNAALFQSHNYIGCAAFALLQCHGSAPMPALLGAAAMYAWVQRAASTKGAIHHIPRLLSHHTEPAPGQSLDEKAAWQKAVADHRKKEPTPARIIRDPNGMVRVAPILPEPQPLVSLIVPTRDRLDLLQPCIESLLNKTGYKALEILIADNQSAEQATLDYFAKISQLPNVRVLSCPGPFNFASINNRAVSAAQGSVLGFINNDIEAFTPGWLEEMVAHAVCPDIGAVGAKLLYGNGVVQHAGVVIGLFGLAGHGHRFYGRHHPGYLDRLYAVQNVAAVTAACLVLERKKFDMIDGFDAQAFPVAFNDVDLCLRLREHGFENLWTPYAELYHKETASRVRDVSKARKQAFERESARFSKRWGGLIAHDPYYNPNLTLQDESFLPENPN